MSKDRKHEDAYSVDPNIKELRIGFNYSCSLLITFTDDSELQHCFRTKAFKGCKSGENCLFSPVYFYAHFNGYRAQNRNEIISLLNISL